MRIINAAQTGVLPLGRLGENEASKVIFDVSAFLSEYPNAAIGLYNQRAGDGNAYPVANISVSGNTAEWLITNTELTKVGNGKCELVAIENNTVVKSQIYCTVVFDALDGSGSAPEPWNSWQNEFIELKNEAEEAASDANEAASHYPRIVNKIWEVWDAQQGEYVSTGIVAEGENGTDGFSPVITVTDISGGHRVSITDKNGTQTVEVMDGQKGADGYSPTASVTQTATGATISITDKQGTTTATVSDGQDGTDGTDGTDAYVYIRYSATEPTQDSDMKTTPDAWIGIYSGDAATAPTAYTAYTWYKIKGETGAAGQVQDVQVNGVSVLNQGVANVPLAGSSAPGVVIINGYGLLMSPAYPGTLILDAATLANIKGGSWNYNAITPYHQHESAFYGLAKAAGDTTQSASSNAVGNYTDEAKIAIKSMLGAAGKFVKAVDITLSNDVAHGSQVVCELPNGVTHIFAYVDIKASSGNNSLAIELYNSDGIRILNDTYGSQISTTEKYMLIEYTLVDDYVITNYNTDNSSSQMRRRFVMLDTSKKHDVIDGIRFGPYNNTAAIPTGSVFKVFVC